ncbi:MAG: 5-oxoprolinase subunit PxpA [Gemmataceae bacterium]|nr:LamB/YcsF family protein [Gemmata sp.]MDW8197707.1 5-oxoprolinase subunit PxpA [Gemmataceae bacterium]
MKIDLNADLGEGSSSDADLMPLITSANVCCGLHAGGPGEIVRTLQLASRFNVVVGAHPGYADREHFGRREQNLDKPEFLAVCAYQLGALDAVAHTLKATIRYVKPHGALYNQVCRERRWAEWFVEAVASWGRPIVGLPDSALAAACEKVHLEFIAEGFADRRYRPDGSLVPRTESGAFIDDPHEAVAQVEWLIRQRGVRTICIHGDNPHAVAFAHAVRAALLAAGYTLQPFA